MRPVADDAATPADVRPALSRRHMDFSFAGAHAEGNFRWFRDRLRITLEEAGHGFLSDARDAPLVVNFFPPDLPRPFRRRARAVFVIAVTEMQPDLADPVREGYPLLVRSLSNLLIGLVGNDGEGADAHFLTLERGHYVVRRGEGGRDYFGRIYDRIRPLATSRLVIDNAFITDLPEDLWGGDDRCVSLSRAGARLGRLGLLPTPFPVDGFLPERDQRHLKRLYGLGGLSYGNLSTRLDESRFWMSASGVDKSNLEVVGRDMLLVKGYDQDRNAMVLSVPPNVEPRRVSVDAIEHWMIYREHPRVGAIVHVHAWMEGVRSTDFNYPCGTYELASAVAEIVREAPDPAHAVVGLKNHGLTITGPSLEEIFDRIEGRILPEVPMS